MYTYIYIYIYIYVYIYIYIHTYIHNIYVYTYIQAVKVCVCVYVCAYLYIYQHLRTEYAAVRADKVRGGMPVNADNAPGGRDCSSCCWLCRVCRLLRFCNECRSCICFHSCPSNSPAPTAPAGRASAAGPDVSAAAPAGSSSPTWDGPHKCQKRTRVAIKGFSLGFRV